MKRFFKIIKKNFSVKEKINKIPDLKKFMNSNIDIKLDLKKISEEKNLKDIKFTLQTFGCAMNFSDSEIVKAILEKSKMKYEKKTTDANLILINTCAIRENAEKKIWNLLDKYKNLKKKRSKKVFIGLLGCMAERLKVKIVEEKKFVDLIVGPDSYKDLPRLINYLFSDINSNSENYAINTQLSIDETYADVIPVRENKIKALVSIMRGCGNMCSFCIVPFVRGVERSRNLRSILKEVRELKKNGVKEITLLGQNVNSYNCLESYKEIEELKKNDEGLEINKNNIVKDKNGRSYDFLESGEEIHENSEGFAENYKRKGKGLRFSGLLKILAKEAPEIRFRFTSPHPKDFPDRVLDVIKENNNICKSIHLPVQSGNTEILEKMNRKHDIESYLKLIDKVKKRIPKCGISTDIIVGFCGENKEKFLDTFNLMKKVNYDSAFIYSYSEREKTFAHRRMKDDVSDEDKKIRLDLLIKEFRRVLEGKNKREIGSYQLVLVERKGKKLGQFSGKSDLYKTVVFDNNSKKIENNVKENKEDFEIGDFVEVLIKKTTSQTLIGEFITKSSIKEFMKKSQDEPYYFK